MKSRLLNRFFFISILIAFSIFAQVIDYIDIIVLPVFDVNEDYWGPYDYRWAYKIANALHIKTRPSTIEHFLPFSVGDSIDENVVAEAERLLRGTDFIGEASVIIIPTDSGNVARIKVTDLWTTKVSPSLTYRGRVLEWSLGVEEINLIGTGTRVAASFRHDEDFDSWSLGFSVPQMLPARSSMRLYYSGATKDIGPTSTGINIYRSRTREKDRFIFGGGLAIADGLYPTWKDNNIEGPSYFIDDYKQYFGAKYLLNTHFGVGLGVHNSSKLRIMKDTLPNESVRFQRKLGVAIVGVSLLHREYFTAEDVDAFGRTEDIPIGYYLWAESGFGPEGYAPFYESGGSFAVKTAPIYVNLHARYSRLNTMEDKTIRMDFFTEKFLSSRLCGKAQFSAISGGLPEEYFRVGGQSCLRAYRTYEQTGQNILSCNIELRTFTPIEIASIRIGSAVFADAGTAWNNSDGAFSLIRTPKPLIGGTGFEFRFASTNSTTDQVLRLSIARAFDGTWEFNIASGQLFSLYFPLEHTIPIP